MSAVQGLYLVADNLPLEDARLIAAAPDLLAACARMLNFITNTEGELGTTFECADLARAAIARAAIARATGAA